MSTPLIPGGRNGLVRASLHRPRVKTRLKAVASKGKVVSCRADKRRSGKQWLLRD